MVHAFSTRHGGTSPAPYDTLNLSYRTGDDARNVTENLSRWHRAVGLDPSRTVDASQAQADRVAIVGLKDCGTRIPDVDALLTHDPGVTLMLRYADCVPILLLDPAHRAIGLVHAGWRGTVAKVTTKALQAMFDTYRTSPADVIACIGPSIGPCCYTVGSDVADQVRAAFGQSELLTADGANGIARLDLWKANAVQMRALGVQQIEIAGLCTAQRTDDFYSWRAEHGKTGRLAALLALYE